MSSNANTTSTPNLVKGGKTKKRSQKGYFKEKYYSNPEYRRKLLAKQQEKVVCDNCNKILNRSSLYSHKKSKKCQKAFYDMKRDEMLKTIEEFNKRYNLPPIQYKKNTSSSQSVDDSYPTE